MFDTEMIDALKASLTKMKEEQESSGIPISLAKGVSTLIKEHGPSVEEICIALEELLGGKVSEDTREFISSIYDTNRLVATYRESIDVDVNGSPAFSPELLETITEGLMEFLPEAKTKRKKKNKKKKPTYRGMFGRFFVYPDYSQATVGVDGGGGAMGQGVYGGDGGGGGE